MTAFLNQWKWDFRRILPAWLPWLILLCLAGYGRWRHLSGEGFSTLLALFWGDWLSVVLTLYGGFLAARLIFFTPLSHQDCSWRVLPIKPSSLFWQKLTIIAVLILLPIAAHYVVPAAISIPTLAFVERAIHLPLLKNLHLLLWIILLSALSRKPLHLVAWFLGTLALFAFFTWLGQVLFPNMTLDTSDHGSFGEVHSIKSLVLPFHVSLILIGLAFFLLVRIGSRFSAISLSIIALFAFTGSGTFWNYRLVTLPSRLPLKAPEENLNLRVLSENEQPQPGETLLCPQLVAKIPDGKILLPYRLETRITDQHSFMLAEGRLDLSPQLARLVPSPPQADHLLPDEYISEQSGKSSGCTTLAGSYSALVIQPDLQKPFPLSKGAATQLDDFSRARVTAIYPDQSAFMLTLFGYFDSHFRGSTELFYNGEESINIDGRPFGLLLRDPKTNTLLQCYYQAQNEARPAYNQVQKANYYCRLTPQSAALLKTLTPPGEHFADLEVLLFRYEPVGNCGGVFHQDDWLPFFGPSDEPPAKEAPPAESGAWRAATLPPNASPAELKGYLSQILYRLPSKLDEEEWSHARSLYAALDGDQLNELASHFPLLPPVDQLARGRLSKQANRTHLPALQAALKRDPSLIKVFVNRGWKEEAAPIVARHLARRSPYQRAFLKNAIPLMTSQPERANHADLAWHFVHSEADHTASAKELATLPGFPLAATVQEAWRHKRGSTRSYLDLASLAAKYGDREALRSVITISSHPFYQRDKHRVLTELVGRPTHDYLPLWCSQNFDLLIYDPETQTYRTKAQTRN